MMAWYNGVPPNEIAPDGSRGIGILNPATSTELEQFSDSDPDPLGRGHFPARGIWPRKYAPHRAKFIANAEEKKRRKVKRKYEVPPGTYRIEWANANPSGASHVEFEYEGGTWYNFDDKWMDVFVEHAVPKVTKDGDKLGEMHSFDAETKLGKDSCCCGATKENPCECMIQGVMNCNATCPCSLEKKNAESDSEECSVCGDVAVHVLKKGEIVLCDKHYQQQFGKYSAEDAEDYGVQPTWLAETEGPSESKSSLDSTNLTHWANANDSDDIKYLIGGFIGGVLATAVGAIAGEWAVQRMKKHGKLI